MRHSELVAVRALDLEPGQRARFPRLPRGRLALIVDVSETDEGACVVSTDEGAYVCQPDDLIDVEDCTAEVCPC